MQKTQKQQKQLLGLAGLAAVGIMTATAYMIPAPNAAAEAGNGVYTEAPEAGEDFQVNVTVETGQTSSSTNSPADGQEFNTNLVPVSIRYERISRLVSTLSFIDESGVAQEKVVDDFVPTGAAKDSGIRTFNIDLGQYKSKDNQYKLTTQAYNFEGQAIPADVTKFSYTSTIVTPEPKPEEGGNPFIEIDVNDDVEKVVIQIYDKDGNPILVDKDGKETPIIIDKSAFGEDGKLKVELPLDKYGVKEGEYTVVVDAYDKNGNIISVKTTPVEYTPATPELPNTGSLVGELNISRLDYIVTGLIAFALISGFAVYLALRKSRR